MAPRLISSTMLDLFKMEDRSPGRHVSNAIFRIISKLHPDRFTGEPINQARANLGNAVEKALIRAYQEAEPDRYVVPGELTYGKVSGTPDLLDIIEEAVVEIKLTWATAARADDIEDIWFWRYWQQGRAYAKMMGWRKVILIIYFINGGWEGGRPGEPCGLAWMDEFSDEELDDTWTMVEIYS